MTHQRYRILRLIRDLHAENGCAPTLRELAEHLGRTHVTVWEHVERLVELGYLRRERGFTSRSLSVTEAGLALFPECERARSLWERVESICVGTLSERGIVWAKGEAA